ncbi:MAG: hypothetical protein, partial [Olavius algarvensis Gamma 1 endosymbiont]
EHPLACQCDHNPEDPSFHSGVKSIRRAVGHRTLPHQAQNASDQRDGRALQRPYRRGLGHHPLRLIRALDRYHQTLCPGLQPTHPL